MADQSNDRIRRKLVVGFVASLRQFSPALYVGQSNNLRLRTANHLNGDTELSEYLVRDLELTWADVELSFCKMSKTSDPSKASRELQELLEFVAQRSLSPLGTKRPG